MTLDIFNLCLRDYCHHCRVICFHVLSSAYSLCEISMTGKNNRSFKQPNPLLHIYLIPSLSSSGRLCCVAKEPAHWQFHVTYLEFLHSRIEKREKYSRRRAHQDEADIDYINERNMKFNKKLARFYDPFTSEIKQNLERGTAI